MDTKWIVFANASLAHIYSVTKSIELVQSLEHSASREKTHDLVEDRPGHYNKGGDSRGAYSPHSTPKEQEQDKFAKEIVDLLEQNRTSHKFQQLIIIAAPRFHGLLVNHIHEPLKKLITKIIEKDIVEQTDPELKKYIHALTSEGNL